MARLKIPNKKMAGEGAFYGPKIDIKLIIDAIGRPLATDKRAIRFQFAGAIGWENVGEDGAKHQPLMVHRALLGSVERFFGI